MNGKTFLPCALLCALLSASCGRQAATTVDSGPATAPKSEVSADKAKPVAIYNMDTAADSAAAFAFRLFSGACAAQPQGNLMLSPLSAGMALGMVAEGATGQTRDELLRALGFGTLGADALHDYYRTLSSALVEADSTTTIGVAGSVWADKRLPLASGYAERLARDYAAQTRSVDFADGATLGAINNWASEQTHGRITRILESLAPDLRLVLLNAVYFKGQWENSFDKSMTREEKFLTDEGRDEKVQMMNRRARMRYAVTEDFEAVELPYSCGRYAMVLLLPRKAETGAEAFARFDLETWRKLQDNFGSADVRLALPRFEAKYSRVLNADLGAMGIRRMFEGGRAELSGISPEPLCVDMVKQDTYVRVDETGTEAAAVTSVTMRLTALQPQQRVVDFRCDRPFGYVICEQATGAVLFAGRMSRP